MEKLQIITRELNILFGTDYTCSAFNNITDQKLLVLVVEVMVKLQLLESSNFPENAPVEIWNTLEAIKYFPEEITPEEFRNGIAEAKKSVLHPILYFLLSDKENIKTRYYLSKYVQQIEIPEHIEKDVKFFNLEESYLETIAEFWNVYRENKKLKGSALECAELEEDLYQMKADLKNINKRLYLQREKLSKEVLGGEKFEIVKEFCFEVKRSNKLKKEFDLEKSKFEDCQETLKKLQRRDKISTLEDLLERCETNKVNFNTVETALLEIDKEVKIFQEVEAENEPKNDELNEIRKKVELAQSELTMLRNPTVEAVLNQIKSFAQTKKMIGRQIEKLQLTNEEILGKIETICSIFGGDVLHGKSLKDYVSKLRGRSLVYKQLKRNLDGMQAEFGILARTLEVLKQENKNSDAYTFKKRNDGTRDSSNSISTDIEIDNLDEELITLINKKEKYLDADEISKFKIKYNSLWKQYENLRNSALLEEIKFNKTKTSFKELDVKCAKQKIIFESIAGSLPEDIETLTSEILQIQDLIQMEMDDLNKYIEEAENYKEKLFRYSQAMIESESDNSYLDVAKEKLKLMDEKKKILEQKYEKQQEEIEMEKIEVAKWKGVVALLEFKIK